jgi:hypothetical protein
MPQAKIDQQSLTATTHDQQTRKLRPLRRRCPPKERSFFAT